MASDGSAPVLPADVLEREDVRAALASRDFGLLFALSRKWAGISYSKIALACDIKPERVGTLARGKGSITSYEKIAQIADAMHIPGRLLGLAPRMWESAPETISPSEFEISRLILEDGESVIRRDFLKTSAAGVGIAAGLSFSDPVRPAGRRLGASLPEQLRRRAARLRRLDDVLGGGDTYRIYLGEYKATVALLREGSYSGPVGRELLSVLAEQAQQAGWAAFDSGNHAQALKLYESSLAAAQQAEDKPLAGNAMAFLAYERIGTEPMKALELATAACITAGSTALRGSVGALLHERRAWANAIAGNASETERALDAATLSLAATPDGPEPDWSAWVDESELQIMAGRCWTELQRPLRAVPILRDVLAGFDDAYARDKALYLSWLADSYLTAGEVEESAAVVDRALDLSAGVASVRPRKQLAGVLDRLTIHRTMPVVGHVLDRAIS